MPTTLTPFVAGSVINPSAIRGKFDDIEEFVNEGIAAGDYDATEFVGREHIYKPEFYGSPSPRMEAESGDTYYRFHDGSRVDRAVFHGDMNVENYIPVPGLCTTVKNHYNDTVLCDIIASFYAWESGGALGYFVGAVPEFAYPNSQIVARFRIHVDGVEVPGTGRRLYNSVRDLSGYRVYARQQFGMIANIELTPGVHQVGVVCRIEDPPISAGPPIPETVGADPGVAENDPFWKDIWIQCKNIIVDVHGLHS